MQTRILAGIIFCLAATTSIAASISGQGTWETTLQGRAPLTPGGTDYQAYYDTVLNLTWLADANLAKSNPFGLHYVDGYRNINEIYLSGEGRITDGAMYWSTANLWIQAMNAANYLGVNTWRLPNINVDGDACGTDEIASGNCDYNVRTTAGSVVYSEMASMYYDTLGNKAPVDLNNHEVGCAFLPTCLSNTGPFSNLVGGSYGYWSSKGVPNGGLAVEAWSFRFGDGFQYPTNGIYGWAVSPGDIRPVPVPAVGWLLAPALGVLGWARRRALQR